MQSDDVPVTVPAEATEITVIIFDVDNEPLHPEMVYVIAAVPSVSAVTNPVELLTEAMSLLLLLHVPPAVPLLVKIRTSPIHNKDGPFIIPALTGALTFNTCDEERVPVQPVTV